jgi:hypothetical protein
VSTEKWIFAILGVWGATLETIKVVTMLKERKEKAARRKPATNQSKRKRR